MGFLDFLDEIETKVKKNPKLPDKKTYKKIVDSYKFNDDRFETLLDEEELMKQMGQTKDSDED